MILTVKQLQRWRAAVGLGATEQSARDALATYAAEGLAVVDVATGRRPTRGIDLDALAEHIGATSAEILAAIDAHAQPTAKVVRCTGPSIASAVAPPIPAVDGPSPTHSR